MDIQETKRLRRKIEKALEINQLSEGKDNLITLAALYSQYEHHEDALNCYKEALSISKKLNKQYDVAVAHRMIAETYCTLGEYKEAVKYSELYLKYSKQTNDKIEAQRGYATKGRIYFCWAESLASGKARNKQERNFLLKESLAAYKKSLDICENELDDVSHKERQEMKARLLQNLGLVMGSLGNMEEVNSYFSAAIHINKKENFRENLYWCYINQGEFFFNANDCTNAVAYFDLAHRMSISTEKNCEALKSVAKCQIKMGNFSKAKNILRKVYRQQLGRDTEVVKQLKITVALCKIEKKIKATSNGDFQMRKKLYETMGDACCSLKCYSQGINAYLKMLECAENAGNTGKELLPCYTSLALTYKDDEEFSKALFYCEKELKLIDQSTSEAWKTYLFLAELYEHLDYDYDTINDTYTKALKLVQETGDKRNELTVLKSILDMRRDLRCDGSTKEIEDLIGKLKEELGTCSDNESESDICSPNFMFDVNDDELFSDVEDEVQKGRSRRAFYKIKRNEKGETELHVAAIKGNYKKVMALIEKGHPVNEKDLAGWTVLHEACNHGHVEIVRLLLESGADVNNPGGKECSGITPLHDAAENGHFAVIELLLRKGASTAVVTNNGDTPLDCLKRWREGATLTPEERFVYDRLCNALKSNLDSTNVKEKRKRMVFDSVSDGRLRSGTSLKRSLTDFDMDLIPSSSSSSRSDDETTVLPPEMYKSAIEGVGRRQDKATSRTDRRGKAPPPLINEDEVVDDWLEDDLPEQSSKRRKYQPDSPKSNSSISHHYEIDKSSEIDEEVEALVESMMLNDDLNGELWNDDKPPSPVFKVSKKRQTNLKSFAGKSRSSENLDSSLRSANQTVPKTVSVSQTPSIKQPEPLQSALPAKPQSEVAKNCDLYKFRVQILDDVFLIPVPRSEMNVLTIQWLSEVVAARYGEIYGRKPNVLIMTGDNAIVLGKDPVCLLVDEEIKTRVLDWTNVTLGERYSEEFLRTEDSNRKAKPNLSIVNALNIFESTGNIILRDLELEDRDIIPVLSALKREKAKVKIMDLSRNNLGDKGLEPLVTALEWCSVDSLYLLSNGITSAGIKLFAEKLQRLPSVHLDKIQTLDFSFNRLRDESVDYLNLIIDKLKNLQCFGTGYCGINKSLHRLRKDS